MRALRSSSSHGGSSLVRRLLFAGLAAIAPALLIAFFIAPGLVEAAAPPANPALLTSEQPAPNAVEKNAPTKITLDFNENITSNGSDIVVFSANGQPVSEGPLVVSKSTMSVNLKANGNGGYLVYWHATSANGNKPSQGAYTFNVGSTAASYTAGTVGSTSAKVQPAASSGIPWWIALVTGIAGILIGAGVLTALRARAPRVATTRPAKQPARSKEPTSSPN